MKDLFKTAAKKKYRFFYKGCISVEDLFDLTPEQLDEIYKSLVQTKNNRCSESLLHSETKEDSALSDMIEIVKVIVSDKIAARENAIKRAEKKARMDRIREIMNDKQDSELKEKTIEELQSMLDDEADEEECETLGC